MYCQIIPIIRTSAALNHFFLMAALYPATKMTLRVGCRDRFQHSFRQPSCYHVIGDSHGIALVDIAVAADPSA